MYTIMSEIVQAALIKEKEKSSIEGEALVSRVTQITTIRYNRTHLNRRRINSATTQKLTKTDEQCRIGECIVMIPTFLLHTTASAVSFGCTSVEIC